jgi:hypothetical protein
MMDGKPLVTTMPNFRYWNDTVFYAKKIICQKNRCQKNNFFGMKNILRFQVSASKAFDTFTFDIPLKSNVGVYVSKKIRFINQPFLGFKV